MNMKCEKEYLLLPGTDKSDVDVVHVGRVDTHPK